MSAPEEHNGLEQLLAGLPAREPSRVLDERVAATLAGSRRSPLPRLAVAAAVLIAGAVALVVVFSQPPSSPGADPPIAREPDAPPAGPEIFSVNSPNETINLLWSRDVTEQTRYTPGGEPYRAVVREVVDHRAWVNPGTGETGTLCLPREEIIVVKQNPF